jgi:hypothetical protein
MTYIYVYAYIYMSFLSNRLVKGLSMKFFAAGFSGMGTYQAT